MRWIGHSGLARHRPGGAPDAEALTAATAAGLEMLEVDVRATADGSLVLVHDDGVPGLGQVGSVSLGALRQALQGVVTLDEADALVAGRVRLLLDLKGDACVDPLAVRLAALAGDPGRFAVCTDDLAALLTLRHRAPAVGRWRTLPMVGPQRGERRRRALAVAGRRRLPARVALLAAEVRAEGLCLDHLVVTPALCEAAHRHGLAVDAWTVNRRRTLARVAAAGVDLVTSDAVGPLRGAGG